MLQSLTAQVHYGIMLRAAEIVGAIALHHTVVIDRGIVNYRQVLLCPNSLLGNAGTITRLAQK